jgi:acetyltransferase-like isoleucine patch superfamily enzyme
MVRVEILLASPKIDPSASVEKPHLLASTVEVRGGARLSGEVRADDGVIVESNSVIMGPVTIGQRTYIGPNCVVGFPALQELDAIRTGKRVMKQSTVIGEDCVVRSGVTIYSDVNVGDGVQFGHNVMVREGVSIGRGSKLGTNVVVDGRSSIGARVSVQTGVYICTFSTVEDAAFLGPCCVFTNDKYVAQKPFKMVGPTVKKGASIGANALLFPGVTVGEGAVVGSQAMVNSDVPPRTIFVGIPAKKLRGVPDDWRSEFL